MLTLPYNHEPHYLQNMFNKKQGSNLQESIFFSAARNIVEDEPDQLNHSHNQLMNKRNYLKKILTK